MTLLEAVPNFSEGRNETTIGRLADAARSVAGVTVLDVERNADHNRSVFSLAGDPEPLVEALVRMSRVAIETIDLTKHRGEHPRMGAVDVVPFVPLRGATVDDAIAASVRLAERVWTELGLPVYLYAQSARRPEHRELPDLRRGEFEGLRDAIATDPVKGPDYGPPKLHPTAGIVAIGARPVLIAFNAYLTTPDVAVAKRIAKAVRAKDGGLPAVKALGFDIRERGKAQVSMNLTDFHTTPVHAALEAVRAAARTEGVEVESTEIVGLVPDDALVDAAEHYLALTGFDRSAILERRIPTGPGGAEGPAPDPAHRWEGSSLAAFAQALSARTPTPGGGSASAAAGAFAAALGEMVVRYSTRSDGPDPELNEALRDLGESRVRLLGLVDRDTQAYEGLRAARKDRKARPDEAELRQKVRAALRTAAEVPLETVRTSRGVVDRLEAVRGRIKPTIASDLTTAFSLARAAMSGAAANVEINLLDLAAEGIDTRGLKQELSESLGDAP